MPITVVAMMLTNSAPFTFLAISTPLSNMAITPSIAAGVNLPSVTNVAGDDTILVVIKDQQKIVPIVEKLKSLLD